MMRSAIFLRASWEYLAMINYRIDPGVLRPYLPPHIELDFYDGKAFVSLVGFLFKNTRVLGVRWPGFVNFEEVNLRFYVKRFNAGQLERGVAFVSEIVPKRLIAFLANNLYNEHYTTARMEHALLKNEQELKVSYKWKKPGERWNHFHLHARNAPQPILPGSLEEFIFEHYVGYNRLKDSTTLKYAIEHPRWQVFPVTHCEVHCQVAALYGQAFVPFIENVAPASVFLANGSEVQVRAPERITRRGNLAQDELSSAATTIRNQAIISAGMLIS